MLRYIEITLGFLLIFSAVQVVIDGIIWEKATRSMVPSVDLFNCTSPCMSKAVK
jgi:hypothetical protein